MTQEMLPITFPKDYDLSEDTVTPEDVLSGVTFHDKDGLPQIGTHTGELIVKTYGDTSCTHTVTIPGWYAMHGSGGSWVDSSNYGATIYLRKNGSNITSSARSGNIGSYRWGVVYCNIGDVLTITVSNKSTNYQSYNCVIFGPKN